ncbi:MAG TPA: hypothetical protein VMW24_24950 [Sedimentisphaerales bacterium]|nr:hypothetical protein [Sedimentisphaerales bacterium]
MPKITAVYWKDGEPKDVTIEDEDLLYIQLEGKYETFTVHPDEYALTIKTTMDDMLVRPATLKEIRVSSL